MFGADLPTKRSEQSLRHCYFLFGKWKTKFVSKSDMLILFSTLFYKIKNKIFVFQKVEKRMVL